MLKTIFQRRSDIISSTNRGTKRRKSDYYVTPVEEIEKFLNHIYKDDSHVTQAMNKNMLDPCAGGDKDHPMSYLTAFKNTNIGSFLETIDIRQDSRAYIKEDYLNYNTEREYDIIISNPPFRDALDFIKKSLNDVRDEGYVIYLLRLNFFGSQKRFKFWQKNMPLYTYVHHKRMSFTDEGGTDSIEYAHFVWQKGNHPKFTKLKVI